MAKFDVTLNLAVEVDADDTDDAVELIQSGIINVVREVVQDDPQYKLFIAIDDVVEIEDYEE